jgi:hypothetical protein
MNPIKSFLALSAILCVSMLYAEDNTYIRYAITNALDAIFAQPRY